ncbi:MAG: DNA-3-methyladenine glycosylase [Candidatus Yanofskybacteria bacterium]|nr:DNA-3-methyladenine glycosylase [Candidatus Yanofskybacteria bacterium]
MRHKRLARTFFNRPTLTVAKELLGKFLIRKIGRKTIAAIITETEAYCGPNDLASHASRGMTKRTEVMFGTPGHAYIYLIYGMYHCFNIVTERDGYPAAVLIRGVKLATNLNDPARLNFGISANGAKAEGISQNLGGPGKLCRYFQINKLLNNEDLTMSKKLWLEDRGVKIKPDQIKRSSRIGVDYAGPYKDKQWRFMLDL